MSVGQSHDPGLERVNLQRTLREYGARIEDLERQKPTIEPGDTWPMRYVFPLGEQYEEFRETADWSQFVVNSSAYLNGYTPNGVHGVDAADGDFQTWSIKLGPQYSKWRLGILYHGHPNGGRIKWSLVGPAHDSDQYPALFPGEFNAYPETFDLSYVDLTNIVDTYSVGSTWNEVDTPNIFTVDGADGDPLTGATPAVAAHGGQRLDGGSGIYKLRMQVDGKHASSGGYECRVSWLSIWRVNDLGEG